MREYRKYFSFSVGRLTYAGYAGRAAASGRHPAIVWESAGGGLPGRLVAPFREGVGDGFC